MNKIIFSLLLLCCILVASCEIPDKINKTEKELVKIKVEIKNLEKRLKKIEYEKSLKNLAGYISLSEFGVFQDIGGAGGVFYQVSIKNVVRHLSGIKITGSMLNLGAVRRENIGFKMSVDLSEKEFEIPIISGGRASRFSVYIPNVDPEDANYAKLVVKRGYFRYSH